MSLPLKSDEAGKLPKYANDKTEINTFLTTFDMIIPGTKRRSVKYMEMIKEVKLLRRSVIEVCLADIATSAQSDLAVNIDMNTMRYIELFEDVVDDILATLDINEEPTRPQDIITRHREDTEREAGVSENATYENERVKRELNRRFEVVFSPDTIHDGFHESSIREVDAMKIGQYVTIKGLITRVGEMQPLVRVVTYFCRVCGYENYQLITKRSFTPLKKCMSRECTKNNRNGDLVMNLHAFKWVKYQEVVLQETSDQIPNGHTPRVLNVQMRGSVTQSCVPGDLVDISGCFLPTPYTGFQAMKAGLLTDTYFHVHHVSFHTSKTDSTPSDRVIAQEVKKLSRDSNVYEKLAESLAPEIYGHADIKKALLLQLISGVTRTTADGMTIRGDINILLMGDPGVAKSQLLKFISNVAPRGVYTTGKGSSSVGLTAGVVRDPETGEVKVEGGALILADNGVCCIDEFDKMNESDRTSIHEVMEQQTISISKAGIQTTLNARVSLLCAANPLFGRYNVKKSAGENINLPTALLSRFDLIFLILDKPNPDMDRELAEHIAYVHKHGESAAASDKSVVSLEVTKAYIAKVRSLSPSIPDDLFDFIADTYVNSRQMDASNAEKCGELTTMTPRQLLSTLRLAQAHAKLHMREQVDRSDVEESLRLVYMSKASILDSEDSKGKKEDIMSSIFSIIREFSIANEGQSMAISDVESLIIRKGYTRLQLEECIDEYSNMNAWVLSSNGKELSFL